VSALPRQSPWWLLLFGVAILGAGIDGLFAGEVRVPGTYGLSGALARDTQAAAYWMLTAAYGFGGLLFLGLGYRGLRDPAAAFDVPAPAPREGPRWARGVAWIGVGASVLLLAAAVMFHLALDPIVRLPFVLLFGGGGFAIGLASVGYLVTGRVV
jgi:hypothetical protein